MTNLTSKKIPAYLERNSSFQIILASLFFIGAFLVPYSVKLGPFNLRTLFFIPAAFQFVLNLKNLKNSTPSLKAIIMSSFFAWAFLGHVLIMAGLIESNYSTNKMIFAFCAIFLNTVGTYCLIANFFKLNARHIILIFIWIITSLSIILFFEFYYKINFYDIILCYLKSYQFQGVEKRYISNLRPIIRAAGPFISPLLTGFSLLLPAVLSIPYLFDKQFKPFSYKLFQVVLIHIAVFLPFSYTTILPYLCIMVIYFLYYILKFVQRPLYRAICFLSLFVTSITLIFKTNLGLGIRSLFLFATTGKALEIGNFHRRFHSIKQVLALWSERDLSMKIFGSGLGQIFYQDNQFHEQVPYRDFGLFVALLLEVGPIGVVLFVAYLLYECFDSLKLYQSQTNQNLRYYFAALGLYFLFSFICFVGIYKYVILFSLALASAIKYKLKSEFT